MAADRFLQLLSIMGQRETGTTCVRRLGSRIWLGLAVGIAVSVSHPSLTRAQPQTPHPGDSPRVLIAVAHPDDESCFSVMTYKITHGLGGVVDQLVITNGEGGYRYSLLAEPIYGVTLTSEPVGRSMLPQIRKQELQESGRILGISEHYFLDQRDMRYTQEMDEVLRQHWNTPAVVQDVTQRLQSGHYDFVLTLFPSPETHGAHKAAAWVTTEAVKQMVGKKPVVLACQDSLKSSPTSLDWTATKSEDKAFLPGPDEYHVNRAVNFGLNDRLTYQIIANWVITAHKSQGVFQLDINRYDQENFKILETNTFDASGAADRLFRRLELSPPPSSEPARTQASK